MFIIISVRVSDLKKKIDALVSEGYECVEVSISESLEFDGHFIPETLHFSAYDGCGGGVDFDPVESVSLKDQIKYNGF